MKPYLTKIVFEGSLSTDKIAGFFSDMKSLSSIEGISNVDTSNVTSMSSLFSGCSGLVSLDLSGLDTSHVTNMSLMFEGCQSLEQLNLSTWDTSNVTTMFEMFFGCDNLTSLDLSNFKTNSLRNLGYAFAGMNSITTLDLSSFDVSSVTSLNHTFYNSFDLESVILPEWKSASLTNMEGTFLNCESLKTFDLSAINTSNVESLFCTFSGCSSLSTIGLSGVDTSNVTTFDRMFEGCSSLAAIDLADLDTSSATDMFKMFGGCSSITQIDLSSFDTSSAENMSYMFLDCTSLTSLTVPDDFIGDKCTNISSIFRNCPSLTTLPDNFAFGSKTRAPERAFYVDSSEKVPMYYGGDDPYVISYTWSKDNRVLVKTTALQGTLRAEGSPCAALRLNTNATLGSACSDAQLTYQWFDAQTDLAVSDATPSSSFDIPDNLEGKTVYCVAQDTSGRYTGRLVSNDILIAHSSPAEWSSDSTNHWKTCEDCGAELEKAPHLYGEWETTIKETCTDSGMQVRYCEICGASQESTIPAAGHSFSEWETVLAPTCTAEGKMERHCTNCEETETKSLPKTNHTPSPEWRSDATDHWRKCDNCGIDLDKEAHSYKEWEIVTEATENSPGEQRRACAICGYIQTAEIPAKGHTSDGVWHFDELAHWNECTGCGVKMNELPHEFGEWVERKAPTCTDEGVRTRTCTTCGYSEDEAIPTISHMTSGSWLSDETSHWNACDVCGAVLNKTGHEYGPWTTLEDATCHETGTQIRQCQICGYSQSEAVPVLDHQFGPWVTTLEATEDHDGLKERICSLCGDKETSPIPALETTQTDDQQAGQNGNADPGTSTENHEDDRSGNSDEDRLARTSDTAPLAPCVLFILASLAIAGGSMLATKRF